VNLRTSLLAIALLCIAIVAQAADPFYMRLLREGTDAYNRRDFVTAQRQLRTACFGLLDEPELLADALVRLGLAQASAGDAAGFAETFQRVAEVEERFGGLSKAAIPKDVRDAFAQLVVKNIPRSTLMERPAIAKLMPSAEDRVAKPAPTAQAAPRKTPSATVTPTSTAPAKATPGAMPAPTRPAVAVVPSVVATPVPTATPTRPPSPTPDRTPVPAIVVPSAAPAVASLPASGSLTSPPPIATAAPSAEAKQPVMRQATPAEQRELNGIQELVRKNKIGDALRRARLLADSQKDLAEAQFVAAELAYRTLRFPEAVEYFRRGGDPGDARPLLLFYEAVSLYEAGEKESAAAVLKRALPNIRRTSYVEGYIQKILPPGAGAARKP